MGGNGNGEQRIKNGQRITRITAEEHGGTETIKTLRPLRLCGEIIIAR